MSEIFRYPWRYGGHRRLN